MVRLATAGLCALALFGLTPSFAQDPSRVLFPLQRLEVTPYVTNSPDALEAGDFDADGVLDLVVAADHGVDVFCGSGHGYFEPAQHISLGLVITGLAVGDLDGDGIDDLAAGTHDIARVLVLSGSPTAGLGAPNAMPTAGLVESLAIADLDGDGALELIAACSTPNRTSVLWNDGSGSFGQTTVLVGTSPMKCVVIGDWEYDGVPDLAIGMASGVIAVWRGQGQHAFVAGPTLIAPWGARELLAADLDEDGRTDIGVVSESGARFRSFAGDGAGGFVAPLDVQSSPFDLYVDGALADHDGDGHLDLLLGSNYSGSTTSVFLGDGQRHFSPGPSVAGPGAVAFQWRDFDRDGDRDLAIAAGSFLQLSLNRGQALEPYLSVDTTYGAPLDVDLADLDGDGRAELVVSSWLEGSHGSTSGLVNVFPNLGAAGFAPPTWTWYSNPPRIACTLADVNRDGDPDRFVTLFDGRVEVELGAAGATFGPPTLSVVAADSLGVELDDLDGDGNLDLLSVSRAARRISVLLGDGLGSFGSGINYALTVEPHSFALADVDLDGDTDVVLGTVELVLAIALNDGAAQFGSVLNHALDRRLIVRAAVDWNADGFVDVLAAEHLAYPSAPSRLFLIPGVAGGAFAAPQLLVDDTVRSVRVADLDADGDRDLVTTSGYGVAVRFADAHGALIDVVRHGCGSNPGALALADIDSDGRLDIATADVSWRGAGVLMHDSRLPGLYCEPTASAAGCAAQLRVDGCAQASGSAPFIVRASDVEPNVVGGLLYGFGRASSPFQGVTLCVTEPLRRAGMQPTAGSTASSCSGSLALDFNQHLRSGVDPALTIGVEVCAQLWFLDPAPGQRLATTNAVEFTVLP